jgi:hypothetical protein
LHWIDLVEDRDKLWALVNAVMNLLVPNSAMNILNKLRNDFLFKKAFAPWSSFVSQLVRRQLVG